MRLQRGSRTATIAVLVMFGAATTTVAHAQSTDELKQRIEELERSTREQVDALKRMLQQQEAERAKERRAQEERERTLRTLQEQVEQQQLSLQKQKEDVSQALAGLSNFFDLKAGARQTNNGPPPFFGEDIPGNVYSGKDFKIRLGGSLRLHVQHNDTPVGESVSSALLPAAAPGGGNNASREAFRAFVSRTRLNLALQGPETLGAKTSAYFEMDFNQTGSGAGGSGSRPVGSEGISASGPRGSTPGRPGANSANALTRARSQRIYPLKRTSPSTRSTTRPRHSA